MWNELLDVEAYASHRFAGNCPGVRVNRLLAYLLPYGDQFSPDLLMLAREVAVQIRLPGAHRWSSLFSRLPTTWLSLLLRGEQATTYAHRGGL